MNPKSFTGAPGTSLTSNSPMATLPQIAPGERRVTLSGSVSASTMQMSSDCSGAEHAPVARARIVSQNGALVVIYE